MDLIVAITEHGYDFQKRIVYIVTNYCDQSMEYLRRIIVYHTAVMKNVLHIFTVKKRGKKMHLVGRGDAMHNA